MGVGGVLKYILNLGTIKKRAVSVMLRYLYSLGVIPPVTSAYKAGLGSGPV
jgi:hypothetical protein